jgi:trimethyllysine dioxygenase
LTPGQHSSPRLHRKAQSWDTAKVQHGLAPVAYTDLETSGVTDILDQIDRLGFALVQGCPQELTSAAQIAHGVGYVRETIIGGIWSLESSDQMTDTAYTPKALRPHPDSTYSHDAPGLQLKLCLACDAECGESLLVNGLRISKTQRETQPVDFESPRSLLSFLGGAD